MKTKLILLIPSLMIGAFFLSDFKEIPHSLSVSPPPPLSEIQVPADAKDLCPVSDLEFSQMFESGAVTLNGVVKPANSVNFPDMPNCSFYKWTEQMFLWLTSPAPARYGGGAFIFDSEKFFDVSPPDANNQRKFIPHRAGLIRAFNIRAAQLGPNKLPVIVDKSTHRIFEIAPEIKSNGLPTVQNNLGQIMEVSPKQKLIINADKQLAIKNTISNRITLAKPNLDARFTNNPSILHKINIDGITRFVNGRGRVVNVEVGQAGGGQVLRAQNGSLIYYTTIVNEVFAYYRSQLGGADMTNVQFPTTQAQLNNITAFATSKGVTITDPEALAIEIKASWIEASTLPDVSKFITINATVPTYDTLTNPNQWIVNGQKNVKLAMVGMHVVGSTKGHPEMIWGTFEHISNTPNKTYSYIRNNNTTATIAQNTSGNWLFCANNALNNFNIAKMSLSGNNIEAIPPFTVSASNTIRDNAWGSNPSIRPNPAVPNTATSNTQVISMNNNIRNKLINGDIRKNYIQTGSTWTIGGAAPIGAIPNSTALGTEVGTSELANTTMETYQQSVSNCFSCHKSNKVRVSHVFRELQPLN